MKRPGARRRRPVEGQHRSVREYGRIGALGAAFALTAAVAVASVLAPSGDPAAAEARSVDIGAGALVASVQNAVDGLGAGPNERATAGGDSDAGALPAESGKGRRVVFSLAAQRVWLVRGSGAVARTYEVSGSKYDNLDEGTYEVYSRSRHATSFDLGSTMEYFVRFTRGDNAAIGFHDIPVDRSGERVQTRSQLGEERSSGCIRQAHKDAEALWEFAPVGTKVVVLT